jgi:hypothetical protein
VRYDDVIDVAALGGDERRQEAVLILSGARGDRLGVADIPIVTEAFVPAVGAGELAGSIGCSDLGC